MRRIIITVSDADLAGLINAIVSFASTISIEEVLPTPMKLEQPPMAALVEHRRKYKKRASPPATLGIRDRVDEWLAGKEQFVGAELYSVFKGKEKKVVRNMVQRMRTTGQLVTVKGKSGSPALYRIVRGDDAKRLLSGHEESRKATEG